MMAEECTHDCSSCGSACASRQKPQSLLAPANAGSRVKKVIGVVSGKGGVGKSTFTVPLASCLYYTLRHDVHVVDCDYQSSDMRAVEQTPVGCRPERRSPPFPTVASSKMPEMEIRKARPSGDSHGLAYFHLRRLISCRRK